MTLLFADASPSPFDLAGWATVFLGIATAVLAIYTRRAVIDNRVIAGQQRESDRQLAGRQLGAEMWLRFIQRFDSETMEAQRRSLATDLLANPKPESLPEALLEFFEDLAIASRRKYIAEDLAECSFSYYVRFWWAASKAYVEALRERKANKSLFVEFERLANQSKEASPSSAEIKEFLIEERGTPPLELGQY